MIGVILASGYGERMGASGEDTPKGLIPIHNNICCIDLIVEGLVDIGIERLVVTTGFKAEKIKEHLAAKWPAAQVDYAHNDKYRTTNYIYSIWLARHLLENDVMLIHGDMALEPGLLKELACVKAENALLIDETTEPPDEDFKAEIVEGIVRRIGVDLSGGNVKFSLPVYKLSQRGMSIWMGAIDKAVKRDETGIYPENLYASIADAMSMKTFAVGARFCREIDRPADLDRASIWLKERMSARIQ